MPFDQVMHKFKHGILHSGSKSGPKVTNKGQALAILMSEKRKAASGDKEYQSKSKKRKSKSNSNLLSKKGIATNPSTKLMSKYGIGAD